MEGYSVNFIAALLKLECKAILQYGYKSMFNIDKIMAQKIRNLTSLTDIITEIVDRKHTTDIGIIVKELNKTVM
jgi:hypothetical protein